MAKYDIAERITDEYVFFYGGVFSNWYQPNIFKGDLFGRSLEFNCSEQYMMAGKALFFEDEAIFEKIMVSSNPSIQKQLGKKVKNFDADEWSAVAKDVVFNGCFYKFTSTPKLTRDILGTGDRHFVEASPYDPIWGVLLAYNDSRIDNPANWRGTNWLGLVLDNVREAIRKIE